MKKIKLTALLLAMVMTFSALAACTPAEPTPPDSTAATGTATTAPPADDTTAPPAQVTEKVYRFADTYDIKSLNAHNDVDSLLGDILAFTHSPLYRRVPTADGSAAIYVGDLADGEPIQIDDYTWQIKLRKEAKWNNGDPINADTIMYSFKMLIDPALVNQMANFFYDREISIVNGYEYFVQNQEGKDAVEWEDVGIKKIDDYTIELKTVQRYRAEDVKRHFTDRSTFPVYEPYYEAGMNDSRTQTTYGTTLDKYMGCGPYIFERWNPDGDRVYVKNPDHWMAEYFNYDRVEVRIAPDSNARLQLFENGEVDYLSLNAVTLESYRDDPRTREYIGITTQHIDINSLNTNNPILQTLNFRRAIYYAMDRETISKLVGTKPAAYYINSQAGAFPEQGITYRMTPEAQAVIPENYGYDPAKAVEYFEAALAEVGATTASVELMHSDSSESGKLVAEYLQQALAEIFGADRFTLTLRSVPSSNYTAMKNFKEDPNSFDMAFGGWGASLSRVYPYAALQYFVDAYASRPNSYISADFDAHFEACKAEEVRLDPQRMVEMTAELESIYLRDVVNVPLYENTYYYVYADRLSLPCDEYIPGFGFGTMYGDIVE